MSKRDRIDHAPNVWGDGPVMDDTDTCATCGRPVATVYHRPTGRYYWRHVRRNTKGNAL